jgi:hypothetical protein
MTSGCLSAASDYFDCIVFLFSSIEISSWQSSSS